jgi:hypothetical protein
MKRKINLMLWVRKKRSKNDATADPEISIYLRISVQGRRHQLNVFTGFDTVKSNWQAAGQQGRVRGKSETDLRINAGLNALQTALRNIHDDLERQCKPVTARSLWDAYLKKEESLPNAPVRRIPFALPVFTWPRL